MSIVLGINYGHDGSVCIVRNGKLEIAIATERITRRKKDFSITDEVIHYVLKELNLSICGWKNISFSVANIPLPLQLHERRRKRLLQMVRSE